MRSLPMSQRNVATLYGVFEWSGQIRPFENAISFNWPFPFSYQFGTSILGTCSKTLLKWNKVLLVSQPIKIRKLLCSFILIGQSNTKASSTMGVISVE